MALQKLNGVQLSGTMACTPGADNFDFRVYVKFLGPAGNRVHNHVTRQQGHTRPFQHSAHPHQNRELWGEVLTRKLFKGALALGRKKLCFLHVHLLMCSNL